MLKATYQPILVFLVLHEKCVVTRVLIGINVIMAVVVEAMVAVLVVAILVAAHPDV